MLASDLQGSTTSPFDNNFEAPPQDRPKRVLLIDDEERLLLGLAAIMKRAGYEAVTASNGAHGLEMARSCQPDMIVCDVMMPPPDGFEVRNILSNDPLMANVPFLFLTARANLDDKVHGLSCGADDYITKPFERQELLARVEAIFRRQELGRQRGRADANGLVDKLQDRILDTVSSELRSPVSHLLMNLKGMLIDRFGDDEDRLREFVESSIDNASRLQAMIDDLSILSSLERGFPGYLGSPVDVRKHIREPIQQCAEHWRRWQMRDIDLSVIVDSDFKVIVDGELFKRAVYHLVDNACKFSPEGGRIEVIARGDAHGGGRLTVRDEGQGVIKLLREKVFECFFQGELSEPGRQGGLGIGLTIAQAVAKLHGGTATILDSTHGCVVELTIPSNGRSAL